MIELKRTVADKLADARARITEHETSDMIAQHGNDNIVMVDLRDALERQSTGYIPGSVHAPRGMIEFLIDPASPAFKDVFNQDKQFVFYCASGGRSALTVDMLQDMGFNASHMKGGFGEWAKQQGPIEQDAK